MSRSVPESFSPSLVASRRILASTGSVVLLGTAAATAANPSWSCSLVMVNFIGFPGVPERLLTQSINTLVVVVEGQEMWTDPISYTHRPACILAPRVESPWSMGTRRQLPHGYHHSPTSSTMASCTLCTTLSTTLPGPILRVPGTGDRDRAESAPYQRYESRSSDRGRQTLGRFRPTAFATAPGPGTWRSGAARSAS